MSFPSGEFVNISTEHLFSDIRSRGYAMTWTAVMPSIQTYSFDKERKNLTVQYKKLFFVRRPTESYYWIKSPYKEKHWLEPGAKYTSVKTIGYLNEEEIKKAFFSGDTESSFFYPHCKKKNSLWGKFLYWLEYITFW